MDFTLPEMTSPDSSLTSPAESAATTMKSQRRLLAATGNVASEHLNAAGISEEKVLDSFLSAPRLKRLTLLVRHFFCVFWC